MRRIAVLSCLVACSCADSDPIRPPMAGVLQVEAETSSAVLDRGEQLLVTLKVTNPQPQPVVRQFASGCIYGFSIRTSTGQIVAPPEQLCTQNTPTVVYEPGETLVLEFLWTWENGLAPGTYEVLAGFGSRGTFESAPPIPLVLRSP